jgi:GntR family transcriptional regulator, vanillate catabolism transcriptional regulator
MLGQETGELSQTRSAAEGLRQLILDGELRAGDRFTQERVAARLGVSRAPLRMALEQLKHQGMLDSTPGGRFVVRSFSLREVGEAIHLRGQLEGAAARLAAQRRTGSDPLRRLDACVTQLDRVIGDPTGRPSGSLEQYGELNDALHAEIFVLADSDALSDAYEALMALPFARPSALLAYRGESPPLTVPLGLAQVQHHRILNAIRTGDGETAESEARNHAELARHDLHAVVRRGAAIATLPGGWLVRSGDALSADDPESEADRGRTRVGSA